MSRVTDLEVVEKHVPLVNEQETTCQLPGNVLPYLGLQFLLVDQYSVQSSSWNGKTERYVKQSHDRAGKAFSVQVGLNYYHHRHYAMCVIIENSLN